MPNHFHCLIKIHSHQLKVLKEKRITSKDKNEYISLKSPYSESVSAIIRSFKSAVTKSIHKNTQFKDSVWQTRFHDRIVRDKEEFKKIQNYIKINPEIWNNDCFFIKL
jgi:REP element-mobilizing transposase RayT